MDTKLVIGALSRYKLTSTSLNFHFHAPGTLSDSKLLSLWKYWARRIPERGRLQQAESRKIAVIIHGPRQPDVLAVGQMFKLLWLLRTVDIYIWGLLQVKNRDVSIMLEEQLTAAGTTAARIVKPTTQK